MEQSTPRLILREYTNQDWRAVLAYQSTTDYLRYYAWEQRRAKDVKSFVQRFIDWQHERPRLRFQMAVVLPDGNRLIGSCGIRKPQAHSHQAELGYEIDPLYWGQGYATEAARAMVSFAFRELGLHRIWASCLLENSASARVLEKLGMTREGQLRHHRWMKGRWWDTLIYGLLKPEWKGD